ncbi:MAG: hypothetical protein J7604_24195 [Sporocytophaga sp.]|uniref:hypothetical protein n=1 Tax=Sporocytophaga sp. TaxID=2231183 RepID=UPI001B055D81|nr:hypothetical protein [Sporocytophaga sp.]MBO9703337.1 hypothetical protein [Sporocytophaga sp.]
MDLIHGAVANPDLYFENGKAESTYGYYKVVPNGDVKGLLVLLPGYGRSSNQIIKETQLPAVAKESQIATIFPTINQRSTLDSISTVLITASIKDMTDKYNIPKDRVFLGGFSSGGNLALLYTEMSVKNKGNAYVVPKGVFAVDAPVDLIQLHYTMVRTTEANCNEAYVNEAKWVVANDIKKYGGTPEQNPTGYITDSPYSRSAKNGGNAQYLKDLPVRLYTDPDIKWNLEVRCADYYDMNAFGLAGMIRFLKLSGNKNAELISAINKGYDLNGKRNPHSWSILDAKDCKEWMIEGFNDTVK